MLNHDLIEFKNESLLVKPSLRVLKYLNELCVTAAAPTADSVGEWAKSADQTTMTNFLLFLEQQYAAIPFVFCHVSASAPRVSCHAIHFVETLEEQCTEKCTLQLSHSSSLCIATKQDMK